MTNKNLLIKNPAKFCLIGKIKGLSGESKRTRNSFLKNKKRESQLNYQKLLIKTITRHHLLAYAYLRGLKYKDIERKCADNNFPYYKDIFKIIESTVSSYVIQYHKITEESVMNWLGA